MDNLNGGGYSTPVRGPKIGKGQYAEDWTKEDEEAEKAFVKQGMFDWKELMNWRFWLRTKWWCKCNLCLYRSMEKSLHGGVMNESD